MKEKKTAKVVRIDSIKDEDTNELLVNVTTTMLLEIDEGFKRYFMNEVKDGLSPKKSE